MKNYLKKAISAVIALALAASIVPATFAANVVLTDVPDTANYATAVNTLVALEVIDGYEDNSFKPDNLITRAEASKIVVAALNETASAEAMKGATKFSDIEAKHEWATGYINKGVSMGYINGMENNQFQPDGNVTYAQVIKMMLCAMGYEDYAASLAQQYGYTGANWYIPFTQLADDAGVSEGVYAAPNEAVTRAQVAQLVYNAIKAPVVKNTGVRYTESGAVVPNVQVQNGEQSTYWKSILTEKFDAYFVEGYVTGISKDTTLGLKADEVNFGIAKTLRYNQDHVGDLKVGDPEYDYAKVKADTDRIVTRVKVGNTDAADYKGVYATAILMLDDYADWNLVSFIPSGRNKTYTFDIKDLDNSKYPTSSDKANWDAIKNTDKPYLSFFVDGAKVSTKYMLDLNAAETAASVTVYVNGVDATGADAIWNYVINSGVGEVELIDTYKTNGKIDTINVSSYVTGQVDGVSSNGKITLDGAEYGIYSLTLDEDDTAKEFHIYYNGEEITVDQLKEDDVLTVSYDVTAASTSQKDAFAASKFYDVYVSRDVVTDTLSGKNAEDQEAKFGDTYYPFITGKYSAIASAQLGDEYIVYLDAFGRVFKTKINSSVANWGVADKFALTGGDDEWKLTVFTADGTTKVYYFDATNGSVTTVAGSVINKTVAGSENALNAVVEDIMYVTAAEEAADALANGGTATIHEGDKEPINGRVIQYKVHSSTGKIRELKFMNDNGNNTTGIGTEGKGEYSARKNKIDTIELGDATKIVDARKYASNKELLAITPAGLTDESYYKAYAYGDKTTIGYFPFVLITEGDSPYNATTRFAVVTKDGFASETDEETRDTIYSIAAMYGDATELLVTDDVSTTDLNNLKKGDVIYFKTNDKGYITEFIKIFWVGASIPAHDVLASGSLVANNTVYTNLSSVNVIDLVTDTDSDGKTDAVEAGMSSKFTTAWTGVAKDDIQLIYGPVLERDDNFVTFAMIDASGNTDTNAPAAAPETVEFAFADKVNVYTYDYSLGEKFRFDYSTARSAVIPSNILETNMTGSVIDWDKQVDTAYVNQEAANFAFAVVVEDEIVDIFEFIAD